MDLEYIRSSKFMKLYFKSKLNKNNVDNLNVLKNIKNAIVFASLTLI